MTSVSAHNNLLVHLQVETLYASFFFGLHETQAHRPIVRVSYPLIGIEGPEVEGTGSLIALQGWREA